MQIQAAPKSLLTPIKAATEQPFTVHSVSEFENLLGAINSPELSPPLVFEVKGDQVIAGTGAELSDPQSNELGRRPVKEGAGTDDTELAVAQGENLQSVPVALQLFLHDELPPSQLVLENLAPTFQTDDPAFFEMSDQPPARPPNTTLNEVFAAQDEPARSNLSLQKGKYDIVESHIGPNQLDQSLDFGSVANIQSGDQTPTQRIAEFSPQVTDKRVPEEAQPKLNLAPTKAHASQINQIVPEFSALQPAKLALASQTPVAVKTIGASPVIDGKENPIEFVVPPSNTDVTTPAPILQSGTNWAAPVAPHLAEVALPDERSKSAGDLLAVSQKDRDQTDGLTTFSRPVQADFSVPTQFASIPTSRMETVMLEPSPFQNAPTKIDWKLDQHLRETALPQASENLVATLHTRPNGQTQLRLSPEELGHIQFDLQTSGHKVHVAIQADRPDVLDFMRRNSEHLLAELRNAGFSDASLSFGSGSDHQNKSAFSATTDHLAPFSPIALSPDGTVDFVSAGSTTDRLDLRL